MRMLKSTVARTLPIHSTVAKRQHRSLQRSQSRNNSSDLAQAEELFASQRGVKMGGLNARCRVLARGTSQKISLSMREKESA